MLIFNQILDYEIINEREGHVGEKLEKKWEKNTDENSGPLMLLPVDHLKATDCNGDRSCQYTVRSCSC